MDKPRLLVDADSCPALAKNVILKAAVRLELEVFYFANRDIPFSIKNSNFKMVIASNTENAADDCIVEAALPDDIVITRDIPLAKRLVEKSVTVMNDRGTLFDANNVEQMLKQRELNMQMVMIGVHTGSKLSNYGKKELYEFSNTFDRTLQKKMAAWKKATTSSL